jgi:hypothetical protein
MIVKFRWICIFLFVSAIVGCRESAAVDSPLPTGTKKQSRPNTIKPGENNPTLSIAKIPSGVYKTPNFPGYHWPADFKLPLIIEMKVPEAPKEIQGPSPPIK